ncbi:RNA polymerase sigma factor [Nannocystaceae bacterium ST9]
MATDDKAPKAVPRDEDREDRELLAEWVAGASDAGDKLTIRYFRRLRAFFVHRVSGEHEDLVQETFMQLSKSKQNYRGEAPVRVFVFKIARYTMLQHLRRVSRRPEFDTFTSSLCEAYGRRPSSMMAESDEHQILLDALQDIPVMDHDLLTFYYWVEMTGPELGDLFNVPVGTIRGRLAAARKRLRERFEEISRLPRERMPTEEAFEMWLRELSKSSNR